MDKMQMNFDFLTRETIALSEAMLKERLIQNNTENEKMDMEKEVGVYPESPGVIYYPEFGGSTFCVRGIFSENMNKSFLCLKAGHEKDLKKLKLESFNENILNYFETSSFELAQMIYDQMINKRMLFHEELVCNISDPGFSWWMDINDDGFKVYFKSYGIKKTDSCIKLGPIGDRALVNIRFKQILPYLNQYIKFKEFSIDEASLVVKTTNTDSRHYLLLKELFTFGSCEELFDGLPTDDFGQTLFYYFKELEVLRSFWLKIEEKLALEQISKQR